jgi:hypothetical protein
MTAEERDFIASAGERGFAAAGFTWRPYPPPAGTTYRLTIGQFYDVRNEHSDYHAEYLPATDRYDDGEHIFVHGDGQVVHGVTEVFCSLEREES